MVQLSGHMGKGLKQMQQKLKSVDLLIEVHDARIPFSGRNPKFKETVTGVRPHILVLNKKDLADLTQKSQIMRNMERDGISSVIFTNCKDQGCPGVRKIVPTAKDLISKSNRFNRSEENEFKLMIIGVPNVGKSSIINALRNIYLKKGNAAPVGGVAGVTRSVMSKIKVSQEPLMYILDTPGILEPSVSHAKSALKLAVCSSMQDHLVGKTLIADFLLYWLNKRGHFSYVNHFGLKEPTNDITELLVLIAVQKKKVLKVRNASNTYETKPDLDFAASCFLQSFRGGELGKYMLDKVNE